MVDTGSDITVVGTELAKKMRWQIYPTKGPRVLTASGELLLITGEVRQPLFVGSRSLDEVPVYVSPDYNRFIGMDWMKKQGAFSWDIENDKIRFGEGIWIDLHEVKSTVETVRRLCNRGYHPAFVASN